MSGRPPGDRPKQHKAEDTAGLRREEPAWGAGHGGQWGPPHDGNKSQDDGGRRPNWKAAAEAFSREDQTDRITDVGKRFKRRFRQLFVEYEKYLQK